jgi:hypothetical protein
LAFWFGNARFPEIQTHQSQKALNGSFVAFILIEAAFEFSLIRDFAMKLQSEPVDQQWREKL